MALIRHSFVLSLLALLACSSEPEVVSTPEDFPTFEVLINEPEAFDGYILLRKIKSPGAQFAINNKGEVIWLAQADTTLLRVFNTTGNSIISLIDKRTIVESTFAGDTLKIVDLKNLGLDKKLHHEVLRLDDDTFIGISHESMPIDFSMLDGEVKDTLRYDGIIKFNTSGKILWQWRLTDVLDPLTDPDVVKAKKDWGHANSLAVDTDGHYLISFRDFNQVWKIDSDDGSIIWKYGEGYIENPANRFYGQHAIHINRAGDYMLYDNGMVRHRKTSRGLSFNREGEDFVTKMVIELPDTLFSWKQGSVYQIAEDRFLFCNSMRKKLAVTNKEGEILWLAKTDTEFYRAYYLGRGQLD